MILGIGTDLIEVERIGRAVGKPQFCQRVYTPGEQRYCMGRGAQGNESFAARFAGKEAVLKALGTGLRGGTLQEIEILPDELGCPQVRLSGQLAGTAAAKGVQKIWISLSHTARYATAQCVMEGDG